MFVVHFGKLPEQIDPEKTNEYLPTNKNYLKQRAWWLFCIFRLTEKHLKPAIRQGTLQLFF